LIGAGTGLGVSGLIPYQDTWLPLASEGGHVSVCASCPREADIIAITRRRYPHVSAERLVSGMGLQNLYRAIAELEHAAPENLTAAQIGERALVQQDRLCAETLDVFCAIMGSIAGNLAMTLGVIPGSPSG
jgi:glucokinase